MQRGSDIEASDEAPPVGQGLAALAGRQHGVVAWRQLRALGCARTAIHRLTDRGHLHRVHHGVYAVGHLRLSVHGIWMAAVLACGPTARLGEDDAAALHDLCRPSRSPIVHVIAATARRHRNVRCHTTRDPDRLGDLRIDGIPVTTIERTVLDLAATRSVQRTRTLLEDVQRRDAFDLRRFETEIAAANGHRGVGRLREALAALCDTAPAIRSRNEARLLEIIRGAGLPEPHVNSIVGGVVVDFHWPGHGLVVELDADFTHRTAGDDARDAAIDAAVAHAGQRLRRVHDTRLGRPAPLVTDLRRWLDVRG